MNEWRQLILFEAEEEFPLTLDNARILLLRAVMVGNIVITRHFKDRGEQRGFTTIDVERVLRDGKIICPPEHCQEFNNWVFRIGGKCETRNFEARVALDWTEDLELPTIIYITGIAKGEMRWPRREARKKKRTRK